MSAEQLQISQNGMTFLKETSKWALFLAIMGYIGIGFMVLLALMVFGISAVGAFTEFGILGGGGLALIYLVMAGLYFIPVHYLYKFSEAMKKAVNSGEDKALENGLKYLKKHYKFIGIMMIVIMSLYVLMLFVTIAGGISDLAF